MLPDLNQLGRWLPGFRSLLCFLLTPIILTRVKLSVTFYLFTVSLNLSVSPSQHNSFSNDILELFFQLFGFCLLKESGDLDLCLVYHFFFDFFFQLAFHYKNSLNHKYNLLESVLFLSICINFMVYPDKK